MKSSLITSLSFIPIYTGFFISFVRSVNFHCSKEKEFYFLFFFACFL